MISKNILLFALVSVLCVGRGVAASPPTSSGSYSHLDRAHSALKAHKYQKAFAILHSKAKSGCPYSQTMLGHMYATGVGVTQNFEKATKWFERAAEQGYGQAQLDLGKLYMGSERILNSEEHALRPQFGRAVFWLRKAAAQGIDEAHALLAKIPGEQKAEYKLIEAKAQATKSASQAESGVVTGWKGYADMTNTLNQASQHN